VPPYQNTLNETIFCNNFKTGIRILESNKGTFEAIYRKGYLEKYGFVQSILIQQISDVSDQIIGRESSYKTPIRPVSKNDSNSLPGSGSDNLGLKRQTTEEIIMKAGSGLPNSFGLESFKPDGWKSRKWEFVDLDNADLPGMSSKSNLNSNFESNGSGDKISPKPRHRKSLSDSNFEKFLSTANMTMRQGGDWTSKVYHSDSSSEISGSMWINEKWNDASVNDLMPIRDSPNQNFMDIGGFDKKKFITDSDPVYDYNDVNYGQTFQGNGGNFDYQELYEHQQHQIARRSYHEMFLPKEGQNFVQKTFEAHQQSMQHQQHQQQQANSNRNINNSNTPRNTNTNNNSNLNTLHAVIDPITNQPMLTPSGQQVIITQDQMAQAMGSQNFSPQGMPVFLNYDPSQQYMFPFMMNNLPFGVNPEDFLQGMSADKHNFKSEKKKPVILDTLYKE
jgi:hypothetical protein